MGKLIILLCIFFVSRFSYAKEQFSCSNYKADYSFSQHFEAYIAKRGNVSTDSARNSRQGVYDEFFRIFYKQLDARTSNPATVAQFFDLVQAAYLEAANQTRRGFQKLGVTPMFELEFPRYPDPDKELLFSPTDLRSNSASARPEVVNELAVLQNG